MFVGVHGLLYGIWKIEWLVEGRFLPTLQPRQVLESGES